MNNKDFTKEYKNHLESLNKLNLKDFIGNFKFCESYKAKELYLNEFYNKEILTLLQKEEFIKIYYLEPQAKYLCEKLNLIPKDYFSSDLDLLKTLVYCYNTNSREFNKNLEEQKLKEELLKRGFTEQKVFSRDEEENKKIKEELKKLSGLKVFCVFDMDKIGLMGSFINKEEKEGKFYFDEQQNSLFFLPKRHTRTGQILINKFYYKLK